MRGAMSGASAAVAAPSARGGGAAAAGDGARGVAPAAAQSDGGDASRDDDGGWQMKKAKPKGSRTPVAGVRVDARCRVQPTVAPRRPAVPRTCVARPVVVVTTRVRVSRCRGEATTRSRGRRPRHQGVPRRLEPCTSSCVACRSPLLCVCLCFTVSSPLPSSQLFHSRVRLSALVSSPTLTPLLPSRSHVSRGWLRIAVLRSLPGPVEDESTGSEMLKRFKARVQAPSSLSLDDGEDDSGSGGGGGGSGGGSGSAPVWGGESRPGESTRQRYVATPPSGTMTPRSCRR
jgi:hypothetical protein